MTDLFELMSPPAAPVRDTTRAAAKHIAPTAPLLRQRVLDAFEHSRGMTADECAARLALSILTVRPRVTELSREGKLRDGGDRRPNGSGRKAIVWVPVFPAGLKGQRRA